MPRPVAPHEVLVFQLRIVELAVNQYFDVLALPCVKMDSSHALNSEHTDTGMVIPSFSNDQSTVFCNMNPLS